MRYALVPGVSAQMADVEKHIKEATRSRQAVLADASARLAASGGKRLRPLFVLLGGAFGTVSDPSLPKMAAAMEILHMATLVHDDIIDDATLRRGSQTAQARYGKDVAVFVGDFLFAKALMLLEDAKADLGDLAKALTYVCEGEVSQYTGRFRIPSPLEYFRRIRGKTAALFAICLTAGARQCEAGDHTIGRLGEYGRCFGMAFQIHDDMLDYTANEGQTGKPVTGDVLAGVYTLPLVYALGHTRLGEPLSDLLRRQEPAPAGRVVAAERVVDMVRQAGGISKALRLRDRYTARALEALHSVPDNEARAMLEDLPQELFGGHEGL